MSVPRAVVHQPWPGVIEAYRDRLPVAADWTPVTLQEGGTPLIRAPRLSEQTGCTVYLKVEGLNPTGSFKDRGMTMAVTDAVARGQQAEVVTPGTNEKRHLAGSLHWRMGTLLVSAAGHF